MIEAGRFAGLHRRIIKIVERGKLPIYRFSGREVPQQAVELSGKAAEESDMAWLTREMPDLNLPDREQRELLNLAHFSDFNDRSQF